MDNILSKARMQSEDLFLTVRKGRDEIIFKVSGGVSIGVQDTHLASRETSGAKPALSASVGSSGIEATLLTFGGNSGAKGSLLVI